MTIRCGVLDTVLWTYGVFSWISYKILTCIQWIILVCGWVGISHLTIHSFTPSQYSIGNCNSDVLYVFNSELFLKFRSIHCEKLCLWSCVFIIQLKQYFFHVIYLYLFVYNFFDEVVVNFNSDCTTYSSQQSCWYVKVDNARILLDSEQDVQGVN